MLGDLPCGVDLTGAGYNVQTQVQSVQGASVIVPRLDDFEPGWFTGGGLTVLSGGAKGLSGAIKRDFHRDPAGSARQIDLWHALRAPLVAGDIVHITAGCDKRLETCRFKFNNLANYQGFPDIPGEDWLAVTPSHSGATTGGSRR